MVSSEIIASNIIEWYDQFNFADFHGFDVSNMAYILQNPSKSWSLATFLAESPSTFTIVGLRLAEVGWRLCEANSINRSASVILHIYNCVICGFHVSWIPLSSCFISFPAWIEKPWVYESCGFVWRWDTPKSTGLSSFSIIKTAIWGCTPFSDIPVSQLNTIAANPTFAHRSGISFACSNPCVVP